MSERRLIDAVRFREVLERYYNAPHVKIKHNYGEGMRLAIKSCIELLDAQRTVEHSCILCRECQHSTDDAWPAGKVWCRKICRYMQEDGFCSLGERRNNERKID